MNVYLLSGCSRGSLIAVKYHATLAGAHANAKEASYPSDRREIRIDLIDVGTDKATVLRMLNAEGGYQVGGVQRSWSVTDRGGLAEVKVGD